MSEKLSIGRHISSKAGAPKRGKHDRSRALLMRRRNLHFIYEIAVILESKVPNVLRIDKVLLELSSKRRKYKFGRGFFVARTAQERDHIARVISTFSIKPQWSRLSFVFSSEDRLVICVPKSSKNKGLFENLMTAVVSWPAYPSLVARCNFSLLLVIHVGC